jgi:hypothetical protein
MPFERDIRLFIDQTVGPVAAQKMLVDRARSILAEFMAGQAVKPLVRILTDGRETGTETTVRPFGLIRYEFLRIRDAVSFALREAERLSPVSSGRYRKSWVTLQDGVLVGLDAIDGTRPVMITNTQPYSRKINTGSKGFKVYAGIVDKVRAAVRTRYRGAVTARVQYVELSPGYRLRRRPRTGQSLVYPAVIIEVA